MKKTLLAFAIVAALAACSSKNSDPVSFNTLEDARATARANAEYNAAAYRAENPRLANLKIVGHGDSTQTNECPMGDGWASLSIMNVNKEDPNGKVEKYKVKCSTVSASLGCYLEADFVAKKSLAQQENQCDRNLPFPLPKIAK